MGLQTGRVSYSFSLPTYVHHALRFINNTQGKLRVNDGKRKGKGNAQRERIRKATYLDNLNNLLAAFARVSRRVQAWGKQTTCTSPSPFQS
jgi:hypothetical protein